MSLDLLVLGPYVFTDFSVPDRMPFGGRQQTIVHKMPGGFRTVDCMGPDDSDRTWHGILWGDTAFDDMLALDAMRAAGAELGFSWGAESRTVVISDLQFEVQKFVCVHYQITVVFTDDSGGGGLGGLFAGIDAMVGADLSAAAGLFG